MNSQLWLSSAEMPEVELYSIGEADLENLRNWKNEHRESFFFKGIISPEDQRRWFVAYCERPDDYMFVIRLKSMPIGCIGFRLLDKTLDIYNVILGVAEVGRQGWMRQTLRLTCTYALSRYPGVLLGVKVLCANPAVDWYKRNGFVETRVLDDHFELDLDLHAFQPCERLQVVYGAQH